MRSCLKTASVKFLFGIYSCIERKKRQISIDKKQSVIEVYLSVRFLVS